MHFYTGKPANAQLQTVCNGYALGAYYTGNLRCEV
jgi:hypothetical protein